MTERLELTGLGATLEGGDTAVVQVTRVRTEGSQTATTRNPPGVAVTSSAPTVLSVSAQPDGRWVLVAQAPGSAVVSVRLDTLQRTQAVTVTPALARQLVFPASAVAIPAARPITLPLRVLGKEGRVLDLAPTLTVVGQTGGTLTVAGGRLVASSGLRAATVRATANGVSAQVAVLVASEAPTADSVLWLSAPSLRAGDALRLPLEAGQAPSAVRVGGQAASLASATDQVASYAVPRAVFGTCLPGGATLSVEVQTSAGRWAVPMPALNPVPITVTLNDVVYPVDAIRQGCLVALEPGAYDVQFYRWDLGFDTLFFGGDPSRPYLRTPAEPVSVRRRVGDDVLSLTATSAPLVREAAARMVASPQAARLPVGYVSSDVVMPTRSVTAQFGADGMARAMAARAAWRTSSGGSCPIPTTVGDTVILPVKRTASGLLEVPPGDPRTTMLEPWTLAAISPHLAVLVDSAYIRRATPESQLFIERLVAAYDTTVIPWLASVGETVPDFDRTGRLVMLMTDPGLTVPMNAFAAPSTYGRPDCPVSNFVGGRPTVGAAEGIWLTARLLTGQNLQIPLSTIVHETGHIVDLARRSVDQRPQGRAVWWAVEGAAELTQVLWARRATAATLTQQAVSGIGRTIEGSGALANCVSGDGQTLSRWFTRTNDGYFLSCHFLSWALQQGARDEVSLGSLLRRIYDAPSRNTMAAMLAATRGTTAADFPQVIGDFFASLSPPSQGLLPRFDVVHGMQQVPALYPVVGLPLAGFQSTVEEVDLKQVRVGDTREILLDIGVLPDAFGTRLGVGIRRR